MGAVAHVNLARLLHPAGDPRVTEFVDAIDTVNRIAERRPGFIWRMTNPESRTEDGGVFEQTDEDPLIASSLPVWVDAESLRFFVQKTLHEVFLCKRTAWFQPISGPVYVIWSVMRQARSTMLEAKAKLTELAANGPSAAVHDFKWLDAQGGRA